MVTPPLYLGVDVGSGSSKACVLDDSGRVVGTAAVAHPTVRIPEGGVEQEADSWIASVSAAVKACLSTLDPKRVAAMSVTGPAHAVVLTDEDGLPLRRVLMGTDSRPQQVASAMLKRYGSAFLQEMYVDLNANWTLPQLAWLQSVEPEIWPKIRWVLPVKDFVVQRLTGNRTTDPSDAAGTAFWEPRQGRWSTDLCADIGLTTTQLPSIQSSTAIAGQLRGDWAERFGLTAGLPIAVGATDTACELVALGGDGIGDSIVKIASTGTVVCVGNKPAPGQSILVYPHVSPGRWFMLCAMNAAGTSMLWVADLLGASTPEGVEDLMGLAEASGPGAKGVAYAPFLEGERSIFSDASLGAAFVGLRSGHGRGDLARAVLEGVALTLRACREVLVQRGLRVESPWLTGGGLRTRLWRDIVTSVLGVTARVPLHQGSEMGAARIAAMAIGAHVARSVEEERAEPVPEWVQIYEAAYEAFLGQARTVGKARW